MLTAIQVFVLIFSSFFLLSILLGMYRPVLVLWFLDRFNRRKVLNFYGKSFLITILIWGILEFIQQITI
ncbi:hypothetical protein B0E43_19880 [Algoriphagus sp. A40]|nr:hypothetical protein B0E43_19880 [Algoriphagus sp. A40]